MNKMLHHCHSNPNITNALMKHKMLSVIALSPNQLQKTKTRNACTKEKNLLKRFSTKNHVKNVCHDK